MAVRRAWLLFLVACGGGGDGDDTGSGGAPGTGVTPGMVAGSGGMTMTAGGGAISGPATFTRVYNEILNAKGCTGSFCHGMGLGNLLMTMDDPGSTYASLVDAPAAGVACASSGKRRVVPGDPDASLILEKLSPTPSCGDSMPIGTKFEPTCLVPDNPSVCTTQAEIALVRAWILAGAPNN